MGGKSSTTTQSVSIPPEVLARYNSVNARAESVAQQPFQRYGGEFVAGLTQQQQAGMANTNAAANQAQPYYAAASNTQNAAYQQGMGQTQQAYQPLAQGQQLTGPNDALAIAAQGIAVDDAGHVSDLLGALASALETVWAPGGESIQHELGEILGKRVHGGGQGPFDELVQFFLEDADVVED